jgi:hypothetical protein
MRKSCQLDRLNGPRIFLIFIERKYRVGVRSKICERNNHGLRALEPGPTTSISVIAFTERGNMSGPSFYKFSSSRASHLLQRARLG